VNAELTEERRRRLAAEAASREREGEDEDAIYDWLEDELARYSRAEHILYHDDPLFVASDVVAATIRRLKKWHRSVGRSVGGEGFEDLLASVWRDVGIDVVLAPRNYDGGDAHLNVVANLWVAMSLKSEGAAAASKRTIHLSSVSPHRENLDSPEACRRAVGDALKHLGRYDRMIYLRASEDCFPGGDDRAQPYTLLELPRRDIIRRLLDLTAADLAPLFADREAAQARNSFTVPVHDARGRKRFSVTVSRRPPRVSITSIDFGYCELIASYWTEPVPEVARLSRDEAVSGRFDASRVPRWDTVINGRRFFGHESR
jgi:hypothetical protein